MGRNDCHLFGIEFVFQGLSYRVTIPDILKLQVLHFFRPRAHPWPPKKEAFPQCKIVTYDAKILGGHGCALKSDKNQIVTLLHCTMNLQNVTILNRFSFWGANSTRWGHPSSVVQSRISQKLNPISVVPQHSLQALWRVTVYQKSRCHNLRKNRFNFQVPWLSFEIQKHC